MLVDRYGRPLTRDEEWRSDRWENHQTGIGTGVDKTTHGRFFPVWRIQDQELTNLYSGSDLAAKIIDDPPKHMFREGFDISADKVKESEAKDVLEYAQETFELEDTFTQAMTWGRLYGGNLLVMGLDDGRFPWEPLDENNIRSFDWIAPIDRRFAYPQAQYSGLDAPRSKYGTTEVYLISNAVAGTGWDSVGPVKKNSPDKLRKRGANVQLIHETRVIRFEGNPADVVTKQQLAGWTWSILQRIYDAMRQFEHSFDSVGYLLSDASQMVYKLQGLFRAIATGQRQAIADRAIIMEQNRSVMRGILLDAGSGDGKNAESAERQPTPFAGVSDLLDRMMMRLAAAANRPVSALFGRSPAGLNATGQSDMQTWYDDIASDQKRYLAPRLRRVLRLVALSKRGPMRGRDVKWDIDFAPLYSPTDKEVADAKLANAQADVAYIGEGVVSPEEVAVGLRKIYPHLDIASREQAIVGAVVHDPHENEPDPPVPEGGEPLSPGVPVPTIGKGGPKKPVLSPKQGVKPKPQPGAKKPTTPKPGA